MDEWTRKAIILVADLEFVADEARDVGFDLYDAIDDTHDPSEDESGEIQDAIYSARGDQSQPRQDGPSQQG